MMTNSSNNSNNKMISSETNNVNDKRNLNASNEHIDSQMSANLDEDMLEETVDSDKDDTNDDTDSDSGSVSDGDESAEIDEEECDRRKDEYVLQLNDLEKQFLALKEQLYYERMSQVEQKLEEVRAGRAQEYLQPLEELQDNMRIRTEVAGVLSELKIANIRCQFDAEMLANKQNYESERQLLKDSIRQDVAEKLRRLEEDRNSIDSDLWSDSALSKKKKKYGSASNYSLEAGVARDQLILPDRRRKPVTVSGPYIVYMLKESDIMEDWNVIRRALKSVSANYM